MKTFLAFMSVVSISLFASAATVSFVQNTDLSKGIYRVSGAQGAEEKDAVAQARVEALVAAAQKLSGEAAEKAAVGAYARSQAGTWKDSMTGNVRIVKRAFADDDESIMLDALVEVDMKSLQTELETAGVLKADADVASDVGNPTILVVPSLLVETAPSQEQSQLMNVVSDRLAGYFTSKQWNVVDRQAVESARQRQQAMQGNEGLGEDANAILAQLVGANVYIVYSVTISTTGGMQATVSIKAYDTATAQVLSSAARPSRSYAFGTAATTAIYDALDSNMPSVLEQIRGYWAKIQKDGRRYKIVVRADFSNRSRLSSVRDALKGFGAFDSTVKTPSTLAGILSSKVDPDDLSDDLLEGIKSAGFPVVRYIVEAGNLFIVDATGSVSQ